MFGTVRYAAADALLMAADAADASAASRCRCLMLIRYFTLSPPAIIFAATPPFAAPPLRATRYAADAFIFSRY